jgi:hypothetical protein
MLMDSWALIDRTYSIQLLKKHINVNYQLIIKQWQKAQQLNETEWDLISKLSITKASLNKIIFDLIEDNNELLLPDVLLGNFYSNIKNNILKQIKDNQDEELTEAYKKFLKFISAIKETKKETNSFDHFLSDLFGAIANNDGFFTNFSSLPYNIIEKIILLWAEESKDQANTLQIILKQTPGFIKDFVLANWYSSITIKEEEVENNYDKLLKEVNLRFETEIWFLVKLIIKDMYGFAEKIATNSPDKDKLLPVLRRVYTVFSPDKAKAILSVPDVNVDPIGHFILLPTVEDRIDFLKNNYNNSTIFDTIWSKPNISNALDFSNFKNIYNYYSKNTKKEEQFKWILKIKGYYYYDHSDVDYRLLHTLVVWSDKSPDEAKEFMTKMYKIMIPLDYEITLDLIRNSIFERCRTVLSANPEVLNNFISWIKMKLVSNGHRYTENYQTYILRLPYKSLLYQSILAAEKVSNISAKRCDEILVLAMKNLIEAAKSMTVTRTDGTAISLIQDNNQLITYAAKLYASDKGFDALNEKLQFSTELLVFWQIGIIEASMKHVTNAVINGIAEQVTNN